MPSRIFADGLLDGTVALVTGGGTNLGLAGTTELVAAGATVVIAGRRHEVLEAACSQLGDRCTAVTGDIRDPAQARAIVASVVERHGRLDFLLNNAGGQYFVPAEQISAKGWSAVQRLNVGGTLNMISAACELGFGDDGGTIVDVTVSPHLGFPAMAHTGAARAAVEAAGREAAERHRDRRISVVGLAIGRFDTESLRKYPAVLQQTAAQSIPLQRLGTLDEFGWVIGMLASPLGHALSGSVVTLDGGYDNWFGPWPNEMMSDPDGTVPIEDRPARPAS